MYVNVDPIQKNIQSCPRLLSYEKPGPTGMGSDKFVEIEQSAYINTSHYYGTSLLTIGAVNFKMPGH